MALTRVDSYLIDLDAIGGITFDDQAGTPTFHVNAITHRVGIGTFSPVSLLDVAGDVTISGNGYLALPSGTSAERPSSPANGMIRYNESVGAVEAYIQGQWLTQPFASIDYGLITVSPTTFLDYGSVA
jgi:hypothetical protein